MESLTPFSISKSVNRSNGSPDSLQWEWTLRRDAASVRLAIPLQALP